MIQVAYLVVALKYDLNLSVRYSPSIQGGDFIRGDGTGSTCTVLSFHCHNISTAALFSLPFGIFPFHSLPLNRHLRRSV
jgi:hypothetical protein